MIKVKVPARIGLKTIKYIDVIHNHIDGCLQSLQRNEASFYEKYIYL